MGKVEPQVRFSIPEFDEEVYPEVSSVVEETPDLVQKSEEETMARRGHLVDMQSKVMIDVPEDIWRYHLHRKTKSMDANIDIPNDRVMKRPGHARSKSLQSIIVETMHSYQDYNSSNNNDDNDPSLSFSQVSPLHLATPTKKSQNLYLSSESPLNKYKMPIPAQISLPPFLSPENKYKRRNSVVYDGSGYSTYLEGEESSSFSSNNNATTEEEEISDNSIPSAKYDISFDPIAHNPQETDHFLGIDADANVNLKVQNRNLRLNRMKPEIQAPKETELLGSNQHRRSHSTVSPQSISSKLRTNEIVNQSPNRDYQPTSILKQSGSPTLRKNVPPIQNSPSFIKQTITPPRNRNSPPQNSSLKILATPSKTIDIPDLEKLATPASTHSRNSLKFFDQFDDSQEKQDYIPENIRRIDNMDNTFKFPATNDTNEGNIVIPNIQPRIDSSGDFLKVDQSPTNPQFEQRRQKLMRESISNPKSHMHRRSRSIHTAEDTNMMMFEATSTPPKECNRDFAVPQRSPLRPKSPTLSTSNILEDQRGIDKIPKIEIVATDNEETTDESIIASPIGVSSHPIFEDTQDSYQFVGVHDISESDPLDEGSREEESVNEVIQTHRIVNPLTSFASFNTPLQIGNKPSLLVRNQLPVRRNDSLLDSNVKSNSGSVSSRTSIFSKNSRDTALTSNPSNYDVDNNQPSQDEEIQQKKRYPLVPIDSRETKNPNISNIPKRQDSVFEKVGDKIVEVIVLDDDDDDENEDNNNTNNGKNDKIKGNNITQKPFNYRAQERPKIMKYGQRKTIFRENELLMDRKTRDAKRRSFHEAHRNYEDILNLCEEAAETAREVIYCLNKEENNLSGKLSIHPYNSLGSSPTKSLIGDDDIRKKRYLENFNRKLRVNSHTRAKSTTNN
ncbi:Fir1p [Nakaseomyces bracarensis]|uniref:Fir1p n=1 Tax=Nakaseomyces bracarensis TaxID=273131 RepID=UPI0038710F8C